MANGKIAICHSPFTIWRENMIRLLMRLVINAAALWVAAGLVDGIRLPSEGGGIDVGTLLIVAVIFGVIDVLIKPIVKLVTCPAYILTLGLFTFIVNAGMLMLTSWIAGPRFVVTDFWAALWGGIIISIVSTLLSVFVSDDDDKRRQD